MAKSVVGLRGLYETTKGRLIGFLQGESAGGPLQPLLHTHIPSNGGGPVFFGPGVANQEITLFKTTIVGGLLGLAGRLTLRTFWTTSNDATALTINLRANGVLLATGSLANVLKKKSTMEIVLRNAANDPVCRANLFDSDDDLTTALTSIPGQVDFSNDVVIAFSYTTPSATKAGCMQSFSADSLSALGG